MAFQAVTLAVTYGLAIAFYGPVSSGLETRAFFAETYYGCIGASIALSVLLVWFRPGLQLYLGLALRCYILIILGYSIGGFLSARLVLGIGLMVEISCLASWPLGLPFSGAAIAALSGAQAWPYFFGSATLAGGPILPSFDQVAVSALVQAIVAATSSWMCRLGGRDRELRRNQALQQANLDTLGALNSNLQGYARTVDEESAERERNRISREIHDISGYILTNIIALMDAAGSLPRDDQARMSDILITTRNQAQEGLRETRMALRKLREQLPDGLNSQRTIFKIVSIFRKIAGIEVDLTLGNLPQNLSRDLDLALYRTVQEALTNAIRHGKATSVGVDFWVTGEELHLTITDNGIGAAEVVKGIGLTGMEERLGALGGSVLTGEAPGGGFILKVKVPISLEPENP